MTELIHVTVNGELIHTTPNHPFYVEGAGFKRADELKVGDRVRLLSGEIKKVDRLEAESLKHPIKVFNFRVADWHDYYVGTQGVLVHNADKPCAVTEISNGNDQVQWNNGWRTSDGKFASPKGDSFAGAWAEEDVWNSIEAKDGWSVIRGRVYVKNNAGQTRVYDGVAVSPSGKNIGIEVKSGAATYGGSQKLFDSGVSYNNRVIGIGKYDGLEIGHTMYVRR